MSNMEFDVTISFTNPVGKAFLDEMAGILPAGTIPEAQCSDVAAGFEQLQAMAMPRIVETADDAMPEVHLRLDTLTMLSVGKLPRRSLARVYGLEPGITSEQLITDAARWLYDACRQPTGAEASSDVISAQEIPTPTASRFLAIGATVVEAWHIQRQARQTVATLPEDTEFEWFDTDEAEWIESEEPSDDEVITEIPYDPTDPIFEPDNNLGLSSPELQTLSQEACNRLLGALPLHMRRVIYCRLVREMSVKETAAALGIAEATVKTRTADARSILRASINRS